MSPVRDCDSPTFEVQCSIFLFYIFTTGYKFKQGCLVNLHLFSLIPDAPSHSTMELEYCESNDGDACGGVFPYKTSLGLCAKCKKLADLEPNSAEYQLWKVPTIFSHHLFLFLSNSRMFKGHETVYRLWRCMEKSARPHLWALLGAGKVWTCTEW